MTQKYGKTSLKIEGLAELLKKMDELPDDVEVRVFKSGLTKSLKYLVEKVKAQILSIGAYDTGRLYNSIKAGGLRKGRGGRKYVTSKVGAEYSGDKGAPHAHLIELGYRRKDGKHIPGRSFLLATAEKEANNVIQKFKDELSELTDKALKKFHKKFK